MHFHQIKKTPWLGVFFWLLRMVKMLPKRSYMRKELFIEAIRAGHLLIRITNAVFAYYSISLTNQTINFPIITVRAIYFLDYITCISLPRYRIRYNAFTTTNGAGLIKASYTVANTTITSPIKAFSTPTIFAFFTINFTRATASTASTTTQANQRACQNHY